jgi:CPA2 family monovalent cation:H+ antiporter-2
LSPIVGYLAGGIALGPFTPGPIGHEGVAAQLAELGVILLMFGVGVHFSVRDLLAVKWIAVPGALAQSLIATAITIGVALAWGWNWRGGLVLGLAVSVASTVVLVRALMDRQTLETREGRIAVGWLIVEDLFSVLVLVLLPLMVDRTVHDEGLAGEDIATNSSAWVVIALTFLKLGILILLVFAVTLMVGNSFYGPGEVIRVILGETVPGASFTVGELGGDAFMADRAGRERAEGDTAGQIADDRRQLEPLGDQGTGKRVHEHDGDARDEILIVFH